MSFSVFPLDCQQLPILQRLLVDVVPNADQNRFGEEA